MILNTILYAGNGKVSHRYFSLFASFDTNLARYMNIKLLLAADARERDDIA